MSTQQAESLITIHNLEQPRSVTRRIKTCLTLATAGIFALTATSPAASADTVDLPNFPTTSGDQISLEALGIAPFISGEATVRQRFRTLPSGFSTSVSVSC